MPELEAIVLRTVDYGEADRIVTLLSPELGKIKGIARSARRSRKRFAAGIEPGTHGTVSFRVRPRAELAVVETLSSARALRAAGENLEAFAAAQLALEVADALVMEEQPSPRTFRGLLDLIDPPSASLALDEGLARFLGAALDEAGYTPSLSTCVVCGASPPVSARFDPSRVGATCDGCAAADRTRPLRSTRDLTAGLIDAVEHICGRGLKARRFLDEMLEFPGQER